MTTFKILLRGSDGQDYVISYEALKQKFGVCDLEKRICILDKRIDNFFQYIIKRIDEIEEELEALYIPKAEKRILEFIKENPGVKTREITVKIYRSLKSRFECYAHDKAFKNLQKSGAIIPTSHGGRDRTWRIKNEV